MRVCAAKHEGKINKELQVAVVDLEDDWREPHKVTCNKCSAMFDSEDDLPLIIDVEDGEPTRGCDTCMTDGYLMNVHDEAV